MQNESKNKVLPEVYKTKLKEVFVMLILFLFALAIVITIVSSIMNRTEPPPYISHLEGVKQMEEIEFVQQQYEEIIPVTSKDGRLEFLLSAPATITGKMDMTQLEYRVFGDSLIKVTLPEASLSKVNINLGHVKDYYNRKKSLSLFLSGGGRKYSEAYTQITDALKEAEKGIMANAIKNDIIAQTRRQARIYLIRLARSLGYHIDFVTKKPSRSFKKDLEHLMGRKLWNQVKHKFEFEENPPAEKEALNNLSNNIKSKEAKK